MDATNIPEWERLLETLREVRCDCLYRLRQMSDPAIRELIARDEQAVQDFAEALAAAAQEARFKVDKRSGPALQWVQSWCDLDAFFYKRHQPDALRRIVAWFKNKDESIFQD